MNGQTPFTVDPVLTAIAVMFTNRKLIADRVSPRIPVGLKKFAYNRWDLKQGFTIPDNLVGRRGKINEAVFESDRVIAEAEDYGLSDPIPNDDIKQAPPGVDPVKNSVAFLAGLNALKREARVAALTFDANNYHADNKIALGAGEEFSDPDSTPIEVIDDALDTMIMRGNLMVAGRAEYSALARNPEVVAAVSFSGTTKGKATKQQLIDLFELDDILIGEAWVNTANKGQAAALSRAWSGGIALIYQDLTAKESDKAMTQQFTAEYGGKVAGTTPQQIGLRGGVLVVEGETVKEVITSDRLGYLITNVIAE
jgi:hypothetical protein